MKKKQEKQTKKIQIFNNKTEKNKSKISNIYTSYVNLDKENKEKVNNLDENVSNNTAPRAVYYNPFNNTEQC